MHHHMDYSRFATILLPRRFWRAKGKVTLRSPLNLTGGGFQHMMVEINHIHACRLPEDSCLQENPNIFHAAKLARALRFTWGKSM